MHFVYKLDNLLRSIRISDENSSITPAIKYFNNLIQLQTFCVHYAPFKVTSSIFNPFWLHLLFFVHLLIILSYKTLKLKSTSNELWKGWKLAWYHHFIHIACARKLRGVTAKTGCTSCTKRTISFEVSGFHTDTRLLYKGISFFWTYLNSIVFLCSKRTIQSHIINFQPFLTSFIIFHAFTDFFEL